MIVIESITKRLNTSVTYLIAALLSLFIPEIVDKVIYKSIKMQYKIKSDKEG